MSHWRGSLVLAAVLLYLCVPRCSSQGWQSLGSDFLTVATAGNAVVVAGANGAVLRSTNSGLDWSMPTTGTYRDLRFAGFVNDSRGWLWADSGLVLQTDDAGATWAPVSVGAYRTVNAFTVAAGVAFVVVDSSRLFASTDVEGTWRDLGRVPTQLVNGIAAVDALRLVAIGAPNRVFRSTNGGATWDSVASGTGGSLNAIAIDSAGAGITCGSSSQVLITRDGGITWQARTSALKSVLNLDGYSCAVIGGRIMVAGRNLTGSPRGVIASSTDLGSTWGAEQSDVAVIPTQNLIAVASTRDDHEIAVGNFAMILRRAPSAQRWTTMSNSLLVDPIDAGPCLRYGAFASRDTIVVPHNLGVQAWLRSTDRGVTWRVHSPGTGQTEEFRDLYCAPASGAAVVGENDLAVTSDAGLTWHAAGTLPGVVSSMAFISPSHWIVGTDGGVRVSSDSGKTWTFIAIDSVRTIGRINVTSMGFLVATGQDPGDFTKSGGVYRSDDLGRTWRTVYPRKPGQPVIAADYSDESTIVVLGWLNTMFRSTDGGVSWDSTTLAGRPTSVRFFNSRDGYIVGGNNMVLRTTDGGATWASEELWRPYRQVLFPSVQDVLLSPDRRTLLLVGQALLARKVLPEPLAPAGITVDHRPQTMRSLQFDPLPTRNGIVSLANADWLISQAHIEVVDISGRTVVERDLDLSADQTLNFSGLPDGVYRASIISRTNAASGWIVIEKSR